MDLNNSTTPEAEKDLAQTPQWFVKAVEDHLHIKFELDVCANAATAKCPDYYSLAERGQDSIILPWKQYNFCNPPYSDQVVWINKASVEAMRNGNTTVLLIPDKPETNIKSLCREYGDTIIHMPFRLKFMRPNGERFMDKKHPTRESSPKFPVMLVVFTPWGHTMPVRDVYVDFRKYKNG